MHKTISCVVVLFLHAGALSLAVADPPWNRHVIDDRFSGADGVRLGDFNRDGWPDVVTGWEESGLVRLYLNPGPKRSKSSWPAVTTAIAKSPEDAVPIDLDGDGDLDVMTCEERRNLGVIWYENPGVE